MLSFSVFTVLAQQSGTLRGQVTDQFNAVIIGATVTAVSANGVERTTTTNDEGNYVLSGLAPGRYTVRAAAAGFAIHEGAAVDVSAERRESLNIQLSAGLGKQEEVTVGVETGVSTEAEANADAIVLRGKDLDALPDDPDALAAALQALAGPSAGPNGGQLFIDGFTGGRLPPKETIREVRVNQNPLNAENDRPGFGRIDILTKPGTDKLRGSAFMNFSDESLNSRNPFIFNRVPYQSRLFGGTLSGTIIPNKASFFIDFQKRDEDNNSVINARILDDALNVTPFPLAVLAPRRFTTFSPRFDYQLNANHTVVGRYTFTRSSLRNGGLGEFSLPERAFDSTNTQHTFQITETAVLSPRFINETRFQYVRDRNRQEDDNLSPSIIVQDAFFGGGAGIGRAFNDADRWELQNYTTSTLGKHVLRFGARVRGVSITDVSPSNFNGTFNFGGGSAPRLDANNQIVLNENGNPIFDSITSLERYRRTLFFQRQGFSPSQIRALGGGATQFSISGGDPEADVSQVDFGLFVQDDWRVRPNLNIGLGLRYETQSNISSHFNFAPRFFFAWAPGGTSTGSFFGGGPQPKMIIRGGLGFFYDRFNESLTLQANRYNGINQQRYNVIDPTILDLFPNIPSVETLSGFAQRQTTSRIADNIEAPYSTTMAINIERQLPYKFTAFAFIFNYRTKHVLRSRNINAPLPGTFVPPSPAGPGSSGIRPFGDTGEIFLFESSGNSNLTNAVFGVRNQFSRGLSIFSQYVYGKWNNDTDFNPFFGASGGTFPANSYDLSGEYGRAAFDVRHRFIMGGSVGIPKLNLIFNPFIIASSGRPFNIITGRDTNGDRLFTERPALATEQTNPVDLRRTPYGDFDLNPAAGQAIIPRNYGQGPSTFSVNLGVSRTFGFGDVARGGAAAAVAPPAPASQQTNAGGTAGGGRSRSASSGAAASGGPPGVRGGAGPNAPPPGAGNSQGRASGNPGGPGGPGGAGGPQSEKRYNVTLSVRAENLFNRTNLSVPNGNLSSTFFGQSTGIVGPFGGFGGGGGGAGGYNRRVEASIRFNF